MKILLQLVKAFVCLRRTILLLISFIIISCNCGNPLQEETVDSIQSSQKDSQPDSLQSKVNRELDEFIPPGFTIVEEWPVDLNQDSIEDVLLIIGIDTSFSDSVLAEVLPQNLDYSNRLPVILITRDANGKLKQRARNDYLLWGYFCGNFMFGDPFYTFPELRVNEDGSFGYYDFFFHCGGGHSETTVSFRYSPEKDDWLLEKYIIDYTSDTPTDSGGYDDHTGSVNKTPNNFGEISFIEFDGDVE